MRNRTSFTGLIADCGDRGCDAGWLQSARRFGPGGRCGEREGDSRGVCVRQAAGGEKAAAKPTGTGWATLRGQFVFDGTPPEMQAVQRDQGAGSLHGRTAKRRCRKRWWSIRARRVSKTSSSSFAMRRASTNRRRRRKTRSCSIRKHCVFLTHVVGVTVGETVSIKNSDPIGHNTNIVGTGFNPTVPAGGAVPYPVKKK